MMVFIGLFLIPIIVGIIINERDYKTNSKTKTKLNLLLILITVVYYVVTFMVNKEPFTFEIERPADYLIYIPLIFLFTPFLWITLGHFVKYATRRLRIKTNSKAKNKSEYIYYRDNLNKLSPGLLMYVRSLEIDLKKAISSSILKLKLNKNIEETKTKFKVVNKDNVLKSEEMILNLIENNKFNEKAYIKQVKKEAYDYGYVKKNAKNIIFRILKIFLIILTPILLILTSIKLDDYVFDNYPTYVYEGKRYVLVEDEIGDIHFDHPYDIDDYYHGNLKDSYNTEFYDKSLIRADLYSNSFVRKTAIMQGLDAIYLFASILISIICVYLLIEQLMYINKNEKRTKDGVDIINKSFALKNFLKDFSDIKNKKEEELILWEYYLVYAVALGVNEKINDKLIEKYIN